MCLKRRTFCWIQSICKDVFWRKSLEWVSINGMNALKHRLCKWLLEQASHIRISAWGAEVGLCLRNRAYSSTIIPESGSSLLPLKPEWEQWLCILCYCWKWRLFSVYYCPLMDSFLSFFWGGIGAVTVLFINWWNAGLVFVFLIMPVEYLDLFLCWFGILR